MTLAAEKMLANLGLEGMGRQGGLPGRMRPEG